MRELIPSLVKTLRRCHSTVRALRYSSAPISGFVRPSARQPGDVLLLRGERSARVVTALADRLPGGQQLMARALGEGLHAHRDEVVMGDPQLLSGVHAAVLTAQPLAVEQVGAGEVRP